MADVIGTTFGYGIRVRLATPAPGGELEVGDEGMVVGAWKRVNIGVMWDKDAKIRRVHRKRLEIIQQPSADAGGDSPAAPATDNED